MKDLPILFKAPLVRAILDGRKTVTRRLCARANDGGPADAVVKVADGWIAWWGPEPKGGYEAKTRELYPRGNGFPCPYGEPGDRLWVRETLKERVGGWHYAADDAPVQLDAADPHVPAMVAWAHHKESETCVSIHMPRWASRITLEIVSVRVERVQDISEADVFAEGIKLPVSSCTPRCRHGADQVHALVNVMTPHKAALRKDATSRDFAVAEFAVTWDAINGKRAPWASNPWVFRVEFKRVE